MIEFSTHTLNNGLRLVHHRDYTSRFAVVNVLYNVGSKYESPERTGLAHLFEHLMFGGSKNIPDYDTPLQIAGGRSNAWTSNDITNYYNILPVQNIETALWLESDRMRELAFTPESLEVQRKVVIEEFKETTLNVPYGDAFPELLKNLYKKHSYRWPVIGKDVAHIEKVTMDEVKNFFYSHYLPSNAIISIVGNISFEEILKLVEKWFGDIPAGIVDNHIIERDSLTGEKKMLRLSSDVPQKVIYKYYKMDERFGNDYIPSDIITDILSGGRSSRFSQNVILKGRGFSSLDASVWGVLDPGLLFIRGRLLDDISFEEADNIIQSELDEIINGNFDKYEVDKCVNKSESLFMLENYAQEDLAWKLAYYANSGDINKINTEYDKYRQVTVEDIQHVANSVFCKNGSATLYYDTTI